MSNADDDALALAFPAQRAAPLEPTQFAANWPARTWSPAERVSAGMMNGIRDQLNELHSTTMATAAWSPFSSEWKNTGSDNTQGDAVIDGHYVALGSLILFTINFLFGASSVAGDGVPLFSLPVKGRADTLSSVGAVVDALGQSHITLGRTHSDGRSLALLLPRAWAPQDRLSLFGFYQAD
jgi:hypothetical protein